MNDDKSDELSGMKILIVDDIPQNIKVLSQTLKVKNFQISATNSGVKALNLAPKLQPDLILLDVMMPGISGIETCKKLKADESTREIPIIFITAKTETEDVLEGFKAGGVDYITKPFHLEEILARVETHLKLRKLMKDKDDLISELKDTQEILISSSKMDQLTGLYNRVGLEERLVQVQSQCQKTSKIFSIIIADIDQISRINGQFGMQVGDQVIIRTATLLKENIRARDLVGRWSSEEFCLLLPETSLEDAQKLAEKIRSCIAKERLTFNQNEILLTLSTGANSCLPEMKWDKCLAGAEEHLNQAKNTRSK